MSSLIPVIVGLAAGIALILTFALLPSYSLAFNEAHCRIDDRDAIFKPVEEGKLALLTAAKLDTPATTSRPPFPEVSLDIFSQHPELRNAIDKANICDRIADRLGREGSLMPSVTFPYWTYLEVDKTAKLINDPSLHFVDRMSLPNYAPSDEFKMYDATIFIQGKGAYHLSIVMPI